MESVFFFFFDFSQRNILLHAFDLDSVVAIRDATTSSRSQMHPMLRPGWRRTSLLLQQKLLGLLRCQSSHPAEQIEAAASFEYAGGFTADFSLSWWCSAFTLSCSFPHEFKGKLDAVFCNQPWRWNSGYVFRHWLIGEASGRHLLFQFVCSSFFFS